MNSVATVFKNVRWQFEVENALWARYTVISSPTKIYHLWQKKETIQTQELHELKINTLLQTLSLQTNRRFKVSKQQTCELLDSDI